MGTKSFATFLLALAALLAISCTSRVQAPIDCRELSLIENLQAKLSRPTGTEELHYWIGQTYNLGLKDVEVAEYEGLLSLRWQTDGATYALTAQDSVPHDARIGFVANKPSFSEVLKCLGWGAPDYYWAFFGDEIPYGRTYTVALYFLGEGGFLASGRHFLTNRAVEPPPLNANLPVSVVVLVKPGSIEEVFSQVNHGISLESRAPDYRPRPWPGSWASLEYVERLWGNK